MFKPKNSSCYELKFSGKNEVNKVGAHLNLIKQWHDMQSF